MRLAFCRAGLVALALCASSVAAAADTNSSFEDTIKALQAQIDALKAKGQTTVQPQGVAIESWLLSAQAIDATANKIQMAVNRAPDLKSPHTILVLSESEVIDAGQIAVLRLEISALAGRFRALTRPSGPGISTIPIAAIASLIGSLKTDTTIEPIPQTVSSALLAAVVASKLNAIQPSAATAGIENSTLLAAFAGLMAAADEASLKATKEQEAELTALKARYDALAARLLTPNKDGVVPLATAARIETLMSGNPYVLSVKSENSSGTLLKRTNLMTALGGEAVFISGGLVSSYRLSNPADGKVLSAGVITCRTTLTSLKRVQEGSWKSGPRAKVEEPRCLP